jgi:hypothetical protein
MALRKSISMMLMMMIESVRELEVLMDTRTLR